MYLQLFWRLGSFRFWSATLLSSQYFGCRKAPSGDFRTQTLNLDIGSLKTKEDEWNRIEKLSFLKIRLNCFDKNVLLCLFLYSIQDLKIIKHACYNFFNKLNFSWTTGISLESLPIKKSGSVQNKIRIRNNALLLIISAVACNMLFCYRLLISIFNYLTVTVNKFLKLAKPACSSCFR